MKNKIFHIKKTEIIRCKLESFISISIDYDLPENIEIYESENIENRKEKPTKSELVSLLRPSNVLEEDTGYV